MSVKCMFGFHNWSYKDGARLVAGWVSARPTLDLTGIKHRVCTRCGRREF